MIERGNISEEKWNEIIKEREPEYEIFRTGIG